MKQPQHNPDSFDRLGAALARVIAALIVLALLSTRPEAAAAYNTPAGFAVLVGGGVCTVVAYLLMLRIARR